VTRFAYKAIPTSGGGVAAPRAAGVVEGALEASDERSLRESLRKQGLIAIEVRPLSVLDALRAGLGGGGLKRSDTVWFFQTLRTLLAGKAPIEEALGTMQTLAPNPRLAEACAGVRDRLRSGETLTDAIERAPRLAARQHLALLRVGLASGRLEHVVGLIDRSIETRERIRRTVAGRMIYPGVCLAVAILAVWVLASFVIPSFAETMSDVGAELPLSTRLTLAAADWLVWLAPLAGLALVGAFATRAVAIPESWKARIDRLAHRTPVVGSMLWNGQAAVATDTLATMIEGGGDVLEGLEQSTEAMSSPEMRSRLERVRTRIREGHELGEALDEAGALPPMAGAIVRVGMASGDLPGALRRASEACLERQERAVARLLTLLEPAIILFLSGVVGWVIYSLVAGILTINDLGAL